MTEPQHFARSMTPRARWYLAIAAMRHLAFAGFAIFGAHLFHSTSFRPVMAAAPLWVWGLLFSGAAFACTVGAWRKSARIARAGLIWSAGSTAGLAAGVTVAIFTGDLASPILPVILIAAAGMDLTICADPLRSPFEDWVEEIITGEADVDGSL